MSGEGRGWFRRRPTGPVYVERIAPVEPPPVTETKRRVLRGDVAGALRYAYPIVLEDLQRAYGVEFPPEWTHEEILAHGVPPGAAPVGEFLRRLYRLYGRARYEADPKLPVEDGMEAVDLLQSIYAVAPMWRLYAWHRPGPIERLFPPRTPAPEPAPAVSDTPEAA